MATRSNKRSASRRSRPGGTGSRAMSSSGPRSTGASARGIRMGLGLTRRQFGRLSGFSERALASWEAGEGAPGDQARLRLIELDRLRQALSRVVKSEIVPEWLDTPNPAFDGLKPLEVVERGEIDRLWRMVFELESGVAS